MDSRLRGSNMIPNVVAMITDPCVSECFYTVWMGDIPRGFPYRADYTPSEQLAMKVRNGITVKVASVGNLRTVPLRHAGDRKKGLECAP